MKDFRVNCRTNRVKLVFNVEKLLMDGEFPVEYATGKIFFRQDSGRISENARSLAAFVLPFACFAPRGT
jgi:hypothetical protein